MASVTLEHLRKDYDDGFTAVHDVTLEVEDGEFVVLVGPSGCGKSTTLRMIAGLESITAGTLRIGDRVVNDVAPKDRDIAMVFQNYALYPHMSVFDNMAFGLKLRKFPKGEIDDRVRQAAAALGLGPVLDRKPKALSGGQRQRVALGRAIVRKPAVFLFDEPLSNLDAKLRVQTRAEISKLHRDLGATMIYVTHDQVEAMTMGDRIVVLDAGHVQQVAPPLTLYNHPANRFVAGFIGSPAMNFVEGRLEQDGRFESEDGSVIASTNIAHSSEDAILGFRPEDVYVREQSVRVGAPTEPLHAVVDVVEPMGSEIVIYTTVGAHRLVARLEPQALPTPESRIELVLDAARLHLFDGRTGESLTGEPKRTSEPIA